jgi:hypothetical protein
MTLLHHRGALLIVFTILCLATLLYLTHPLAQDPAYNVFADQRSFLDVPNFLNVTSNLALIIVSILGILECHKPKPVFQERSERWMFMLFFIAVGLTGIGSAFYHLQPADARLVWDRLPITLVFTTFLTAMISDRLDHKAALWLVVPISALGLASVFYWYAANDLRLYGFVVLFPIILIPLIMWLYPTIYTHSYLILEAIAWVIMSRIAEIYDYQIYALTFHIISGHTLKHLFSAFGVYLILRYLQKRRIKA